MARALAGQAARFVVVGGAGFLIDLSAYLAIAGVGVVPEAAKALATVIAVSVTFGLNRRFTFAASQGTLFPAYAKYLLASAFGAGINWVAFTLALRLGAGEIASVVLASLAAMAFNFFAYRHFAFARSDSFPSA